MLCRCACSVPTTEVQQVGQAIGTFLAWPRHLVMTPSSWAKAYIDRGKQVVRPPLFGEEAMPKLRMMPYLGFEHITTVEEATGADTDETPSFWSRSADVPPCTFHLPDALEIVGGSTMLNISIIQLWAMYLDSLSVAQGDGQVYGFIEPQSIQTFGNTKVQIQTYMQTWMADSQRQIYLAPYIDGSSKIPTHCRTGTSQPSRPMGPVFVTEHIVLGYITKTNSTLKKNLKEFTSD
ncbi:hypothetical protein Fmac_028211 [Flemingia macrophylla]|uniref:Uncharacterized protein n=1 Tax=Flemingia macrophylla TaxID=520843 RepID=A0ABD1L6U9_9FABA